jgi:hypothetical protein
VFRHDEIVRVQRDWETFTASDGVEINKATYDHAAAMLTSMDPPRHTRLRRLITAGFTPRMIGRLEEHLVQRTHRILDGAAEQRSCDLLSDIAFQLPMHVISDIVGIPEPDRPSVFEQTERVLRAYDPTTSYTPADSEEAHAELFGYASRLSEEKRAHPADDVWTLISQAEIVDRAGSGSAPPHAPYEREPGRAGRAAPGRQVAASEDANTDRSRSPMSSRAMAARATTSVWVRKPCCTPGYRRTSACTPAARSISP